MLSAFGIGNPLMDYVTYGDFDLLQSLNAVPGTMNLIDEQGKAEILSRVREFRSIPGGSCANTMRGLSWLSQAEPIDPPLYTGCVGKDEVGTRYVSMMEDLGVEARLSRRGPETGVSIIVVTPDYERTMFTYLGSCREYARSDLSLRLLGDSAFLYFVGYMWDTANQKEATVAAIDTAMQSDVKFAFDLADPFVVQRYRDDFLEWIPRKVDVLFGNREEISLMLAKKESDESLIRSAAQLAPLVIMKVGAKGCYVSRAGRTFHSPANKVEAVDTIGAGDFFSSGFLFGLIKGLDIEKCACLANSLAAEIVGVKGCSLKNLDQKQILACLDASPR